MTRRFNGVNVNSNGRLDFVAVNEPGGFAERLSACAAECWAI